MVHTADSSRALRAVHAAFLLSTLDISVGVIGLGRVGTAMVQALLEQSNNLRDRFVITLKIRAITNSKRMLLNDDLTNKLKNQIQIFSNSDNSNENSIPKCPIKSTSLTSNNKTVNNNNFLVHHHRNESFQDLCNAISLGEDSVKANIDMFVNHLFDSPAPHNVIIDCTNSLSIAERHPEWLRRGAHIVTAKYVLYAVIMTILIVIYIF